MADIKKSNSLNSCLEYDQIELSYIGDESVNCNHSPEQSFGSIYESLP